MLRADLAALGGPASAASATSSSGAAIEPTSGRSDCTQELLHGHQDGVADFSGGDLSQKLAVVTIEQVSEKRTHLLIK